jgi:hypothetical protein
MLLTCFIMHKTLFFCIFLKKVTAVKNNLQMSLEATNTLETEK